MADIDINYLQSWVGQERKLRERITAFPAQALAAALGQDNAPEEGEALPLGRHWLHFHQPVSRRDTDADGHRKRGEFLPPVPLPRRMWAAGTLTRHREIVIGEMAELSSTIASVELKSGHSGPLVFVELSHRLSQYGAPCIEESQTLVYRNVQTGPQAPGRPPTAAAQWSEQVKADAVLLFRYSALSYNSHRIHYDRDYATGREHYPGLVVHGPLLATLLLDLAARFAPAQRVREFRFRALRPTFDIHPFSLQCAPGEQGLDLWTTDQEGCVGLQATADLE